jgi:hypothetical protein
MQKTSAQIADEVLFKLSMRMPFAREISLVRKANLNPADLALQAQKKQLLREGSNSFRTYEQQSRGKIRPKSFSDFDRPQGALWAQGTKVRETPYKPPVLLTSFGSPA